MGAAGREHSVDSSSALATSSSFSRAALAALLTKPPVVLLWRQSTSGTRGRSVYILLSVFSLIIVKTITSIHLVPILRSEELQSFLIFVTPVLVLAVQRRSCHLENPLMDGRWWR